MYDETLITSSCYPVLAATASGIRGKKASGPVASPTGSEPTSGHGELTQRAIRQRHRRYGLARNRVWPNTLTTGLSIAGPSSGDANAACRFGLLVPSDDPTSPDDKGIPCTARGGPRSQQTSFDCRIGNALRSRALERRALELTNDGHSGRIHHGASTEKACSEVRQQEYRPLGTRTGIQLRGCCAVTRRIVQEHALRARAVLTGEAHQARSGAGL